MTTPTKDHVELRSGAYADSVTLLQVSRAVQAAPGVVAAQVAMATGLNLEVLEGMGFDIRRRLPQRHGRRPPPRRRRRRSRGPRRGRRGAHADPADGRRHHDAPPRTTGRALRRSAPARSRSSRCPAPAPPSRRWTRSRPAAT